MMSVDVHTTLPKLSFTKMEGAGNDYVVLQPQPGAMTRAEVSRHVAALCHRRFGVGADGLLLVQSCCGEATNDAPAPHVDAAVRMTMWNADGTLGSFCGNGVRCAAWFARDEGLVVDDEFLLASDAGVHAVRLESTWRHGGSVAGSAVDPVARACHVAILNPVVGNADEPLGLEISDPLDGRCLRRVDVGNPHAVVFLDEGGLDAWPLELVGQALQTDPRFPGGVNVEAVVLAAADRLAVRTLERGCGETWACGSGAVAAVVAAWASGRVSAERIWVEELGGTLCVERRQSGLVLSGPARTVFHGTVPLPSASR